jgi:hypothetical protein
MRRWSQEDKQALRFLAAARYYLPQRLDIPPGLSHDLPPDWELEYADYLRYRDFAPAVTLLERIGNAHGGYPDELQFWKELYFAAHLLGLDAEAARYEAKLQEVVAGPSLLDPS